MSVRCFLREHRKCTKYGCVPWSCPSVLIQETKLNLTMRYVKGILLFRILTVTLSAPCHVQSAQHNPHSNIQKVTRHNGWDEDTRTKQINRFDESKTNHTRIHKMKPSRRRFQEAWSIPIDGDGPNGPHVANVISHRSRKYNRKSPTMPSIVDQPFNRDNRGKGSMLNFSAIQKWIVIVHFHQGRFAETPWHERT